MTESTKEEGEKLYSKLLEKHNEEMLEIQGEKLEENRTQRED